MSKYFSILNNICILLRLCVCLTKSGTMCIKVYDSLNNKILKILFLFVFMGIMGLTLDYLTQSSFLDLNYECIDDLSNSTDSNSSINSDLRFRVESYDVYNKIHSMQYYPSYIQKINFIDLNIKESTVNNFEELRLDYIKYKYRYEFEHLKHENLLRDLCKIINKIPV